MFLTMLPYIVFFISYNFIVYNAIPEAFEFGRFVYKTFYLLVINTHVLLFCLHSL